MHSNSEKATCGFSSHHDIICRYIEILVDFSARAEGLDELQCKLKGSINARHSLHVHDCSKQSL